MARHKDTDWNLSEGTLSSDGKRTTHSWDAIHSALLMDIRDELKRINSVLHCYDFLKLPRAVDSIRRNTARPKKNLRKSADKKS
jgi:hypothetical protein